MLIKKSSSLINSSNIKLWPIIDQFNFYEPLNSTHFWVKTIETKIAKEHILIHCSKLKYNYHKLFKFHYFVNNNELLYIILGI